MKSWLFAISGAAFWSSEAFWTAATAVGTILLVVVAVVSAVIAYRLYKTGVEDRKVDRTIDVLNRFTERTGQAMSPEESYTYLNVTHQGSIENLETLPADNEIYITTRQAFTNLHNYYERIRTLRSHDLIDMKIIFREQGLILANVATVTAYIRPWFERVSGVQYTTIAVDVLRQECNEWRASRDLPPI